MTLIQRLDYQYHSMSEVNLGEGSAHWAIISPSFDTVMAHQQNHTLNSEQTILESHLYAPDLGQTYAHRAKLCPIFGADFWKTKVMTMFFQTDYAVS